ncbi:MAG: hypothetical protein ACI376_04640 [Candidatus Bruticola sp.]
MSTEPNKNKRSFSIFIGRAASYAQVGLIMIFSVYLLWAFLGGLDAQYLVYVNKGLASRYAEILNSGTVGDQLFIEILTLIAPHMHWFYLAVASSLIAFPFLGWLLARMLDCEPKWAGLLPIFGVFSGLNPVRLGGDGIIAAFTTSEQFIILGLQILCIHFSAAFIYEKQLKKRKQNFSL